MATDAAVALGFGDQGVGEDLGVGRGTGGGFDLLAGDDVEFGDRVELVGGGFGGRVAVALLGDDVQQDRPGVLGVAQIAQDGEEMVHVMAVDRADVIEAQFLEEGAAGEQASRVFLGALGGALQAPGEVLGELAGHFAQAEEAVRGHQAREIGAHGTDRGCDGHFVVVQHDDEARAAGAGVVHRLVGHAGAHGAVTDDGDDMVLGMAVQLVGHREAEARGDRGRAVGGAERVVRALAAAGEAGEAVFLAQGADAVAAAGEDLVGVALVADVPDHLVGGGVEDGVQRDGELDDAERGAEMAAGDGDGVHRFGAQLVGELAELLGGEIPQVGGDIDPVEKRGDGTAGIRVAIGSAVMSGLVSFIRA